MKLGYFEGNIENVGDALNTYLWSRLIPLLTSAEEDTTFIGIGSVLDDRFDSANKKIVFGSGARSTSSLPTFDDSWNISFVRGPNTQAALKAAGIQSKYITDPAILISKFFKKSNDDSSQIGIIPYFRTNHVPIEEIASAMGYEFISPTLPTEEFITKVSQCKLIITEAMHGAIIADSLRIPWIAFTSSTKRHEQNTHEFKWEDWCQSMEMEFKELQLPDFWNEQPESLVATLKYELKKALAALKIKKSIKSQLECLSDTSVFEKRIKELDIEITTINQRLSNTTL